VYVLVSYVLLGSELRKEPLFDGCDCVVCTIQLLEWIAGGFAMYNVSEGKWCTIQYR